MARYKSSSAALRLRRSLLGFVHFELHNFVFDDVPQAPSLLKKRARRAFRYFIRHTTRRQRGQIAITAVLFFGLAISGSLLLNYRAGYIITPKAQSLLSKTSI